MAFEDLMGDMSTESKIERTMPFYDQYCLAHFKQQAARMKGIVPPEKLQEEKLHAEREIAFIIEEGIIPNN